MPRHALPEMTLPEMVFLYARSIDFHARIGIAQSGISAGRNAYVVALDGIIVAGD